MIRTRKWGPWVVAGLLILVAIYLARLLEPLTAIEVPPAVTEISYSDFKEFAGKGDFSVARRHGNGNAENSAPAGRIWKRSPQGMVQNSVFRRS